MRYISGVDESIQTFSAPTLTRLTTSGTFVPATTTKRLYVICQGGGGGGGGAGATYSGFGGGGGGCWQGWVDAVTSVYVIGTGGTGGAALSNGTGGTSTYFIDGTRAGNGGGGGKTGSSLTQEAAAGGLYSSNTTGTGQCGGYGGICHDTASTRYPGAGGSSFIGGMGGSAYATPPFVGARYGQGGCGGAVNGTGTGADGVAGVIYVYEYSY